MTPSSASIESSIGLVWGSPQWMLAAGLLLGLSVLLVLWSYARSGAPRRVIVAGASLKGIGFAALALSLAEPLLTGSKPKKGANAFVVLADNSQSLQVRDDPSGPTRGDWMRGRLAKEADWRTRLAQDFDVRNYAFDSHLRGVDGFETLTFDGTGTSLNASLAALARRFRGLPLAGILVFTDGNATDDAEVDWSQLPPVYPVAPPARGAIKDIGVTNVSVTQTNFESAPVVVRADVTASGFSGESVIAAVTDESGKVLERQEAKATGDNAPLSFRFQFRPDTRGIHFYKVHAYSAADEARIKQQAAEPAAEAETKDLPKPRADEPAPAPTPPTSTAEQTLANNTRLVVVDQGGGPYRVLYVSGRPNWEFKFLRRAVADDEQIRLAGLLRIARSQPKFDFRDMKTRDKSTFFKGFENPDDETAERQDQPVLARFGTEEEAELRDGFPKVAADLYRYHAIVIDDLEARFFTQDQLALLRNFVGRRGGGLLMLGGPDSFVEGRYDRTPVGDLLPVYLNRSAMSPAPAALDGGDAGAGVDHEYHLVLTKEGWLQPWVRTRKTEDEELQRLEGMPAFNTLSRVGSIKPGAMVLAQVLDPAGAPAPALVAQPFGNGQVGALMIGDLWRWGMHRKDPAESDLERAWRQTVRWLVGNVPGRLDLAVKPRGGGASGSPAVEITARVRDAEYRPLDNAKVAFKIVPPDGGTPLTLEAEPDPREPGTYAATHVAKTPGGYRVVATATAPDGSAVGEREAGWAAQPSADEFARLTPDRDSLKTIAGKTRGEPVDGANLDAFVRSLESRSAPITEPWIAPLWHHPAYFLLALVCLTAEWGLRRINGLA